MSAPNASRQSPPPEDQSSAQVGSAASGNIDAAPSGAHAQEESEHAKDNVLESNPKGPLDDKAAEVSGKDGRGKGI